MAPTLDDRSQTGGAIGVALEGVADGAREKVHRA